jgi:gamma-glutamylaminecyclotransferase
MKVKSEEKPADHGKIRVFVYGTLKEGHGNHGLMKAANAMFLGYDTVTGPFTLLNLGAIPAVIDHSTANNKVFGEIYALEPEGLASLDLLEGHPNFYQRRKLWSDRLQKRVWMYVCVGANVAAKAEDRVVQSGMWKPSHAELQHWKAHGSQD